MQIEVLADAEAVAKRAAQFIAANARAAAGARGRFVLAVSGGRTPWQMLRHLATLEVPWPHTQLFQVDERVAPDGDPDRNLSGIRENLLQRIGLPPSNMHAMDVGAADLGAAAARYARTLEDAAGAPAVLDVVHLGLGVDGHVASLVPGDPVLDERVLEVALSGPYQGHRRMTLTYPPLNRSRCVLFVVTGADKADALSRLRAGDRSIPAGRIAVEQMRILADAAAAGSAASP